MFTLFYQQCIKHPKVNKERGLLPFAVVADVLAVILAIQHFTYFSFLSV